MSNQKPVEVRAALIEDWMSGKFSKTALAAKYGITRATVQKWTTRVAIRMATPQPLGQPQVWQPREPMMGPSPTDEDMWPLVYDVVRRLLKAAATAAGVVDKPGWLESQNAADLGNFIGIATDKAAGILGALERGEAIRRQFEEQARLASGFGDEGDEGLSTAVGAYRPPPPP